MPFRVLLLVLAFAFLMQRAAGATKGEQGLCERTARELVTTWTGQDNITDYANRQWAGLMGTFYFSRWQTWLDALQSAHAAGQAVDVEATRARIREGDLAWTRRHDTYAVEPRGDVIEVSRRLLGKYSTDASAPLSAAPE